MIFTEHNYRVEESPVSSDKVVFIFTALGTKIGLYRLFVKRLNKLGYSCITYDYPRQVVFAGDMELWRQFFSEIMVDAQERVKAYKQHGATHFYSYGISMGTLVANMFARDTAEVHHVILNLTYGDVARNIWTFKGVKKTKLSLIDQGIDEETVRRNVTYFDPIFNAPGLRGKKVMLQLARHDEIFPYDQTIHTKRAFEAANLDMTYQETKYLRHFLAIAKHLMAIKSIDKFYSS